MCGCVDEMFRRAAGDRDSGNGAHEPCALTDGTLRTRLYGSVQVRPRRTGWLGLYHWQESCVMLLCHHNLFSPLGPEAAGSSQQGRRQLRTSISAPIMAPTGSAHLKTGVKTEAHFPRRRLDFQLLGQARQWFWMQCAGPWGWGCRRPAEGLG